MSGHAQGVLAQLRKADQEPNINVNDEALLDATSDALKEHADDLDDLRRDAHPAVDTPLADTSHTLRQLAQALDAGITHPDELTEYLHQHHYTSVDQAVTAFNDTEEASD